MTVLWLSKKEHLISLSWWPMEIVTLYSFYKDAAAQHANIPFKQTRFSLIPSPKTINLKLGCSMFHLFREWQASISKPLIINLELENSIDIGYFEWSMIYSLHRIVGGTNFVKMSAPPQNDELRYKCQEESTDYLPISWQSFQYIGAHHIELNLHIISNIWFPACSRPLIKFNRIFLQKYVAL